MPAIKRCGRVQHLLLDHALDGAAQHQKDLGVLQTEIPLPLQEGRQLWIGLYQVGKLIQYDDEPAFSGQLRKGAERCPPRGIGEVIWRPAGTFGREGYLY